MFVALELGMTLAQMRREMTYAELQLWLLFFEYRNEKQEEQMKRASRRR